MKKIMKFISVIFLTILMLVLPACSNDFDEYEREDKERIESRKDSLHFALEACTGTCLKREEMAQLVHNFDKVQNDYGGARITNTVYFPELQLVTPGEHEHDENTRYEITLLKKNEEGFDTGLKVSVMSDTSGCKIEESEPQQPTETTETTGTVSGLSAKDIAGSYTAASLLKVNMKGKDEDEPWTEIYSEEFTVTYNVSAVDEKTLRIDLETTKFGEGPYDPATGICEFKIAPEFYEAMPNAKHDDFIRRAAFSRKGDKIQFEMIVVGQDDDSVTIGIKNE